MGTKERNEFIRYTVWDKFGYKLTPGQVEIVRKIAFLESKRLCVSAYTQYGKTFCVSIGLSILIDSMKTKVALIGPKVEQAGILRQYMAELILKDNDLLKKAMITTTGDIKISKEASRKRMTFSNGSEYRVFSAEGDANRLMGFGVGIKDGVGIIVVDEACLVSNEARAKIGRMMGNNPENCFLIELYNPWNRDNMAYKHSMDPDFDKTHIPWQQGVEEGRTTEEFVMEQKKSITKTEFQILYDSVFPDQSEDSLFNFKWIENAFNRKPFELGKKARRIVSCDPADKGVDRTVIYYGEESNGRFNIPEVWSEDVSENMGIVGKVMQKIKEKGNVDEIHVDCIGIGVGVVSRLRELLWDSDTMVKGCHFGEKARIDYKYNSETSKKRFANRKAEEYFRLRDLFQEGKISIPNDERIITDLMAIRWRLNSSGKIQIIDPEKSPDFADALVYAVWKGEEIIIDFG